MNIHCTRIREWEGLVSITRALVDGQVDQGTAQYQLAKTIDDAQVFDTEEYRLDVRASYCANENVAYEAGMRLLGRVLNQTVST